MVGTEAMAQSFTPETARAFDHYSLTNATVIRQACAARGCKCEPYSDVFTFQRWLAQGRAVRKGEHGTRILTLVPVTRRDPENGELAVSLVTESQLSLIPIAPQDG